MSKQLNIHLFNCDRTYKLDVVEKWLNASHVKSKLGIDVKVKQHIFPLSKMTEWSSETIPGLEMDVAVFVVHAHESRLSINEENAGIGYAKLYRALQKRTGGKVLIVIGGDDSYKDENEEDTTFISRWAKRKISSQFSEELIDGRESFIFSWNQEHRAIHVEALVHFLNERKRGEKFEYQPKGKSSQVSETAVSPKANKSTWGGKDPQERKLTQGQNRRDATRLGSFAVGHKSIGMNTYPGASRGKGMTEKKKEGSFRMDGGDLLQSNTSRKASSSSGNTTLHSGKEGSYRHMGDNDHSVGSDPLQSGAFPTPSSGVYPSLYSDKPGGFQGDTSRNTSSSSGYTSLHSGKEGSFPRMGESNHSVRSDPLQSEAFRNPSSGVYPSLYSDKPGGFQGDTSRNTSSSSGYTSLHSGKEGSFPRMGESDHSVRSDPLQSGTFGNSSSEGYPSLYSDKPGTFQGLAPAESKDNLQKDLSILGWDASPEAMSAVVNLINSHRDTLSLSTDTDCLNGSGVNDLITYFEHNPLRYCVLVVDADKIKAMIEQKKGVNPRLLQTADRTVEKGIIITICCPWFQSEQDKSLCGSAIKKAFHESKKVFITWFENGNWVVSPDDLINFLTSYPFPQQPSAATNCPPRGITDKQRLPYPWDYKIHLLSGKTVLVLTRIRNGIISDQINPPDDVQYWKPGFVVPPEIKASLKKNAKASNGELFILMTEDGTLACQVNKKDEKDWKNFILLGLDETIVLQTQLRHGQISLEDKHVVIKKENLRVPQDQITKLDQDYKETPSAHLFIASDSKGNLRFIVKVGTSSKMFTSINSFCNQVAGTKLNPI